MRIKDLLMTSYPLIGKVHHKSPLHISSDVVIPQFRKFLQENHKITSRVSKNGIFRVESKHIIWANLTFEKKFSCEGKISSKGDNTIIHFYIGTSEYSERTVIIGALVSTILVGLLFIDCIHPIFPNSSIKIQLLCFSLFTIVTTVISRLKFVSYKKEGLSIIEKAIYKIKTNNSV